MAGLFKPKMPKVEEPTRMPDPEDPAVLAEKRRQMAEMRARGGRDSTIMSDNLIGSAGKLGA
ncbi:hypothetical protein [Mesorhizobium sp.]|uniref:hypothetical protein n=1 Tax=Mesorhizobium sp. TaxID=1871066 RepID=UPI000FE500FB|nr:hypothetical protein [Mesorhizobium sp.]RWF71875.1 MAG: hypothetical protein EOQ34_13960 [Mesorhizobium sp.]TIN03871.1 MAG: hypothetical protein E5Y38_06325 [Mesorhizobium sp.]TIQ95496.1 MAG: hypothetical protein E5X36_21860 [Mesorhizobium sp.]